MNKPLSDNQDDIKLNYNIVIHVLVGVLDCKCAGID